MRLVRQAEVAYPLGCNECAIAGLSTPGDKVEITDEQVWLCKACLLKAVRMLNGEGEEDGES